MKNLKNIKKFGFSLMEMTLAVLIVAILVVITLPLINRQLEKADEYSYFMAYKSVEKLAGQIVALGDEEEVAYYKPNKTPFKDVMFAKFNDSKFRISRLISKYKDKLAFSETYVFSKLFPKTMAETIIVLSWNSDAYEDLWMGYHVCSYVASHGTTSTYTTNISGKDVTFTQFSVEDSDIQKGVVTKHNTVKNEDGTESTVDVEVPIYYSIDEFDCCAGYTINNGTCREKDYSTGAYVEAPSASDAIVIDGKKYKRKIRQSTAHNVLKNTMYQDGTCGVSSSTLASIANVFKGIGYSEQEVDGVKSYVLNKSASDFCTSSDFKNHCSGCTVQFAATDGGTGGSYMKDGEDDDDDETEDVSDKKPHSSVIGNCNVSKDISTSSSSGSSTTVSITRPTYKDSWCTDYRDSSGNQVYYGMINDTCSYRGQTNCPGIDCQPKSGYVIAANNEKYAASPCSTGETMYAVFNSSTNKYTHICTTEDFNEYTQATCGPHAVYSGGTSCECVSGWTKDASGKCTVRGGCPLGTTQAEDGTCVTNPPIIKASTFCNLVDKHWNVASKSCNFTNGVNTAAYNAALGNDSNHTYLSINSKPNAFKNITPNLILANGLRLWILGNKAASIPALSYYPSNSTTPISNKQNMCEKVSLTTHTEAACASATSGKGYFCKNDKNCVKLDDASYATSGTAVELADARGCCSAADFTDIYDKAKEKGDASLYLKVPTVYAIGGFTVFVDINGTKGEGTLWEDVFPFFISSNGKVYPGYPLDSQKGKLKADGTSDPNASLYLGGNSDRQLPVDVYYYEASASGEAREKKIAFANVSFARGMCSARQISRYTPYCMNLGTKFTAKGYDGNDLPSDYIAKDKDTGSNNPCDYYVCYVSVKNKLKFF